MRKPEKSAGAEHRFETGHNLAFSGISTLNKATGFTDRFVGAPSIEIRAQAGFTFSRSWRPATNLLKHYEDQPILKQSEAFDSSP
jgi:hypothetical protein